MSTNGSTMHLVPIPVNNDIIAVIAEKYEKKILFLQSRKLTDRGALEQTLPLDRAFRLSYRGFESARRFKRKLNVSSRS